MGYYFRVNIAILYFVPYCIVRRVSIKTRRTTDCNGYGRRIKKTTRENTRPPCMPAGRTNTSPDRMSTRRPGRYYSGKHYCRRRAKFSRTAIIYLYWSRTVLCADKRLGDERGARRGTRGHGEKNARTFVNRCSGAPRKFVFPYKNCLKNI